MLWGAGVALGSRRSSRSPGVSWRSRGAATVCACSPSRRSRSTCSSSSSYHGLTLVKSVRYFYPAYPALAVLTGVAFSSWLTRSRLPQIARAAAVLVLGATFLWALAFTVDLPPAPHARRGHALDLHARAAEEGVRERGVGRRPPDAHAGLRSRAATRGPRLPLFDPDSPQKVEILVQALTKADWVAVTSGRVYMNVTRVPAVFPMSIAYYRALFDGCARLRARRGLHLLSVARPAPVPGRPRPRSSSRSTTTRESCSSRRPRRSRPRRRAAPAARRRCLRFLRRCTSGNDGPGRCGASPSRCGPTGGRSPKPRRTRSPRRAGRCGAAIFWYLALALLGALAAPLAFAAFPRFADRGFGFARLLGLVIGTYLLTFGLTLRMISNGRRAVLLVLRPARDRLRRGPSCATATTFSGSSGTTAGRSSRASSSSRRGFSSSWACAR